MKLARYCTCSCLLTILPLTHGATLQTRYSFPAGPNSPRAGLVQASDGNFYGTTVSGGAHGGSYGGFGTVFTVTTNGTLTTLASFDNTNGANPYAGLIQGSDGSFYGTAQNGGTNGGTFRGHGTVFRIATNGALTSLYSFTDGLGGGYSVSGLIQGTDGNFYGTRYEGGSNSFGTVFTLTTNGTLATLVSFANTNGANPYAGLVQGSDGNFYGTTVNGGDGGYGTVFEVTTNGMLTTLASFAGTNGANPYGELVQGADGNFYGTTVNGGDGGYGTVFMVTTSGTLKTLVSFASTNGANPYAGLVVGNDGNFYGTTVTGGAYSNAQWFITPWLNGYGTVFMVTTNGTLTTLHSFGAATHDTGVPFDGGSPYGRLIQGKDGNFYGTASNGGSCDYGTVFMVTTNGNFTTLATFAQNPDGANPYGPLVQGSDGNFYGTTVYGGMNGYYNVLRVTRITYGTVFRLTPNGTLTALASFAGTNGANPYAGLVEGGDGCFYGTTANGGTNGGYGTVFKITTNGTLISLVSFANTNGANPYAGLVQGTDGNFYGTTVNGGDNGCGTVFEVTTNGMLRTLVSFARTNGANPYGGLVQGNDGNFYGTTADESIGLAGTVFMITTNGALTFPYSFTGGSDGANPHGRLVQGSDGILYGIAVSGGNVWNGWLRCGTVFRVATNGAFNGLYSFGAVGGFLGYPLDGVNPYGGLVQGSDGNFYGTTYQGGPLYAVLRPGVVQGYFSYGTVFQVSTNGTFTNLVSFANSNGANPYAGLIQGSDSNLYGTTFNGGPNADNYDDGYGTLFRVILAPTIFSQPTSQTVLPGENATFAVGASGFGSLTFQWRKNGANIAGATDSSLSLKGVTVSNAGNYSVAVSNLGGTTVSSNAALVVACPVISVSPVTLPGATVGQAYSQTNTASGGTGPYTFARFGGVLPEGLVLASSGVLSGTPTRSGNYTFAVKATDLYGCTGTNIHTLAVNCPTITISPATLPMPIIGTPYNQTNTATGGTAPYVFTVTGGSLPPGFVFSSNGVLSGTATNAGNYTFILRVRDAYGCTDSQTKSLVLGTLLLNPFVDSNGRFRAQVVGPPGTTFVVQTSTNLAQPLSNWTSLITNISPSGVLDFTDTDNIGLTNWPQRFYRVWLSP
jgi:uncharacterized repeat protein (TIGR03803 family)